MVTIKKNKRKLDLLQYQLNEIEEANLYKKVKKKELDEKIKKLMNFEKIQKKFRRVSL